MTKKYTQGERMIAALKARGEEVVKHLATCTVMTRKTSITGMPVIGESYWYVGVNGALRVGRTKSVSLVATPVVKQKLLVEGDDALRKQPTPAQQQQAKHEVPGIEVEEVEEVTATTAVRYPNIRVQLTGEDGNAFAILGRVSAALRRAGVPKEERDAFFAEATKGDYDDLLQVCMRWVDVH